MSQRWNMLGICQYYHQILDLKKKVKANLCQNGAFVLKCRNLSCNRNAFCLEFCACCCPGMIIGITNVLEINPSIFQEQANSKSFSAVLPKRDEIRFTAQLLLDLDYQVPGNGKQALKTQMTSWQTILPYLQDLGNT